MKIWLMLAEVVNNLNEPIPTHERALFFFFVALIAKITKLSHVQKNYTAL